MSKNNPTVSRFAPFYLRFFGKFTKYTDSLPQKKRSLAEKALFQLSLRPYSVIQLSTQLLYIPCIAHPATARYSLKMIPYFYALSAIPGKYQRVPAHISS